jgi:chemotaxis protein methyltransferase CheR
LIAGVPTLQQWEFERLRDIVYREAGIWLSGAKTALVASRLQRRLRELRMPSFGAYHRLVQADADERQHMIECICTHETSFFREPRQWEFLEQRAYPTWQRAAEKGGRLKQLRAWSAGCSTGEEPFTIAMSLLRHFPGWTIDVFASDFSGRALAKARSAEWPLSRAEQLPPTYRKEFMLRGDDRMRAGQAVREVVRFAQVNLNEIENTATGAFDLIFCRNVLIYFDAASKARVLQGLSTRLAPGGLLLLGHAEAVGNSSDRLRTVVPTIYALAA